jgi:hypothetical protein|tara:strand:+ start:2705 stop:3211 length:507 start_codon:yes stop_codon:yes gene_type:complete
MARFASGKDAYGISDRSGFRYRLVEMVTEWNGSKVGRDEYEAKHPQLQPVRVGPDPQALHDPRPDQRTEVAVARLLPANPFSSTSSGSAVITVVEPSHGRTSGDTIRFRKVEGFNGFTKAVVESASGYTITVIDSNLYTFTATSGTATTGGARGGGENATVGPVTLEK